MTFETYEYECDDCDRTIRINDPATPEWCPWCGVRL